MKCPAGLSRVDEIEDLERYIDESQWYHRLTSLGFHPEQHIHYLVYLQNNWRILCCPDGDDVVFIVNRTDIVDLKGVAEVAPQFAYCCAKLLIKLVRNNPQGLDSATLARRVKINVDSLRASV